MSSGGSLYPEQGTSESLEPTQLLDLRQSYLVKDKTELVLAHLCREAADAAEGGRLWERIVR